MNSSSHEFRDRLLKMEQASPKLKERYMKEIQAMLEKPLTGIRRWGWLASAGLGLFFLILFGTAAIIAPAEFPWWGRLGFAAGALFGIGWMVLGIRVFWRGSENLKLDSGAAVGMGWGLVVFLVTVDFVWAPHSIVGVRMLLSGLVFLVFAVVGLLQHAIKQSELKTRDKLLEIEYRLAELAEIVAPKKPSP
jgi:hypothetical protein